MFKFRGGMFDALCVLFKLQWIVLSLRGVLKKKKLVVVCLRSACTLSLKVGCYFIA